MEASELMQGNLLTPEEAAERLHLSPATVRRLIRTGELTAARPGMRRWMIPEAAVEARLRGSIVEGSRKTPVSTATAAKPEKRRRR